MRCITTIILSFFTLFQSLIADNFKYKVILDSIPETGFYNILLSPKIISALDRNYGDIRIYNSKGAEVPYIFKAEPPVSMKSYFKEFDLIENQNYTKYKISRILVQNKYRDIIEKFLFIVRNSDIENDYVVKGSDSRKRWYTITKGTLMRGYPVFGDTAEIREIRIPKNNYIYFLIEFNDKKNGPIQILKVGYYNSDITNGLYSEVPTPLVIQRDSADTKKSYITLSFERPYEINKIVFSIDGPELYHRSAELGNYTATKKDAIWVPYYWFEFSSDASSVVEFNIAKTDKINLVVDNDDNEPLKILSVRAFQLNKYLVASLKEGETYEIKYSDSLVAPPHYDLSFFENLIGSDIPTIKTGNPAIIKAKVIEEKKSFFTPSIVWITISIVALLLALLSFKLIIEINRRKN